MVLLGRGSASSSPTASSRRRGRCGYGDATVMITPKTVTLTQTVWPLVSCERIGKIIRRDVSPRAKKCVPNRSAGQDLCLSVANICVPPSRKSLCDGRALAKICVRLQL